MYKDSKYQLNIDEFQKTQVLPRYIGKDEYFSKEGTDINDDDCTIADEFYDNEQHIAADLAKREGESTYLFPKNLHFSKIKQIISDRKRSISATVTTSKNKLSQKIKKKEQISDFENVVCKTEVGLPNAGNAKITRVSFTFPAKKKNWNHKLYRKTIGLTLTSDDLSAHKYRTCSTDSCMALGAEVIKRNFQPYAIISPNKNIKNQPNKGVQTELQKFSALLKESSGKISSTTRERHKENHIRIKNIRNTAKISEEASSQILKPKHKRVKVHLFDAINNAY